MTVNDEIVVAGYTPAVIEFDVDAAKERLREIMATTGYEMLTPDVVAATDTKTAKSLRASLNAMSTELNDARKAIKREYNKPLAKFEGQIKELDEMIQEPKRLLDATIKEREEAEKEERRAALEATYEEFAPALVPVVPFERVLDPRWLNKSYGEVKAENALTEKVAKLAKDRDHLMSANLRVPDETMAEFYRTLDVSAALAYDKERAEELDRIAQMNAEIEANRTPEPEVPEATAYTPEPDVTITEPEPVVSTVPMARDEEVYQFAIEVPKTLFVTSVAEATALKNHLTLLGITPIMKRSPRPVEAVA